LALLALGELDAAGAHTAVKALQLGVLEVVGRPPEKGDYAGLLQFRSALGGLLMGLQLKQATLRARRILAAGQDASQGPACPTAEEAQAGAAPRAGTPPAVIKVVAIGISTGGPNALRRLIPRLPPDLEAPVLVVQHMPPNFTRALAESLDRESQVSVREAKDGDVPLPGEVFIAPGGQHMVARLERVGSGERISLGLNSSPPVNSCRPSVDVLFKSLAPVYGGQVLMAVMTGMGNDGLAGVAELKALGGYCLTQSEESCVVYGMPRAVDEAGLSDEKVPLDRLAERLRQLLACGGEKRGTA
jgi:two-component system chemotaxis response regulator CheB